MHIALCGRVTPKDLTGRFIRSREGGCLGRSPRMSTHSSGQRKAATQSDGPSSSPRGTHPIPRDTTERTWFPCLKACCRDELIAICSARACQTQKAPGSRREFGTKLDLVANSV